MVPTIYQVINLMGALEKALHPIFPSECSEMCSLYDGILPSDEYLLIESIIPLDTYILSKYHLPRLDPIAIKSSLDFPFQYDLTICASLNDGIFQSLDSTIEM